MKLIKRTTLHYQEGTSDKIYEVDLCQVGDRYVVNFRYGRRGSKLQEGVKTTQPVPEAEALKVFDKLVGEKTKKGYQDVSAAAPAEAKAAPAEAKIFIKDAEARDREILKKLAEGGSKKWPLERIIWRAGELKIREATPLLIEKIGSGSELRDYCIAWALGWCGGEGALAALSPLYRRHSTPEFVRRIAFEALLKLADESARDALISEKLEQLPLEVRDALGNNSASDFFLFLDTYLKRSNSNNFPVLDALYQVNHAIARPGLLQILRTAPLRPNYFQRFRHIFKIAEYRLDGEVFGILAYRFDKEEAMFNGGKKRVYEWTWDREKNRYRPATYIEQLSHPESKFAFGEYTQKYLQRRSWRTLRKLGEEGDRNYVKMAVGVLLSYSDADAETILSEDYYTWNRSTWRKEFSKHVDWDSYAGYLTFNHILYENSPRYVLTTNTEVWRCREGYKPGNPEPKEREEAFPELWEQQPAEMLHLLLESNCLPVHHFAVKALRTCQQFFAEIDIEAISRLLSRPYEITAQLGFELARERYNPASPNPQLLIAAANSILSEARNQAYQWIEARREIFLEDSNVIAALITSQQAETREFARRLLNSSILSDTIAKLLVGRLIANLLALPNNSTEEAKEIGETLLVGFAPQLRNLGLNVVLDLLNHPMPEIQAIGARILLNHETPAVNLPPGWLDALLNSPYESVRAIGVRLFGQLPDETLLQRVELLLTMATHELASMRSAIRPALARLANNNAEFAARLAAELIEVILSPEKYSGVHADVVRLLTEDAPVLLSNVPKETTWQLLRAKTKAAQELAGVFLAANAAVWAREFEIAEIVKLANHEIFAAREAAREMLRESRDRLHASEADMLAAARILESQWQDSREFGEQFFSTHFTAEDFTPTVLVSLCDSVREDVRQFGREMVTRHFQEADGQDYLLKFSEHPATDIQLFATNYLETYAAGNAERLQELTPYFISVLSRVNRGGVAKQRIFAFLDAEALKSEAAARVVGEILARQSATISIRDKAAAIQTMLKIHRAYPDISLPIQIKPVVEVR